MESKFALAKEKVEKYGQEHLLKFYDKLNNKQKQDLLNDILNTDFEQIKKLYENIKDSENKKNDKIELLPYVDKQKLSKKELEYYEKIGGERIKNGEYAVVTMAGGQRNETWS